MNLTVKHIRKQYPYSNDFARLSRVTAGRFIKQIETAGMWQEFFRLTDYKLRSVKQVKGKIILVDDEKYEKDFLESNLRDKNWDIKVEYFNNAEDAIKHLKENADEIFLIISDMDMPKMDGMEFKKILDNDEYLRQKTIPFIFASNSLDKNKIKDAYFYRVQGYFQKPMTPKAQAEMLEIIIQYWIACVHPAKDDLTKQTNDGK